jgi:antitoxin ParD1/3/4
LTALDASIKRGLADADAGRTKPAGDVFDRLEAKYRAMAEKD